MVIAPSVFIDTNPRAGAVSWGQEAEINSEYLDEMFRHTGLQPTLEICKISKANGHINVGIFFFKTF